MKDWLKDNKRLVTLIVLLVGMALLHWVGVDVSRLTPVLSLLGDGGLLSGSI